MICDILASLPARGSSAVIRAAPAPYPRSKERQGCQGEVMRHGILVVAQDVMLRSTLARWLMSAGYSVEVAENERRAREVLTDHNVALTILAAGGSVAVAFGLEGSCGKRIVVTDQSTDTSPP